MMVNKNSDDLLDRLPDPYGWLKSDPPEERVYKQQENYEEAQEKEVYDFIEKNDREPQSDSDDMYESMLAYRYQRMRKKSDKDKGHVFPWDTEEGKKILDLIDKNDAIFDFSNSPIMRESKRSKTDYIAKQEPCPFFNEKYAELFRKVQNAIDTGHRKVLPFTGGLPKQGDFVVVGGVIIYVEWIDNLEHRTRQNGYDGRTRCILSNGKQSRLYLQSLLKSMYENDGKIITVDDREDSLADMKDSAQDESDIETGYIYILRTLSDDEAVKTIAKKMYKIGYTTGSVEQRIANAKNEATYLCAPVQIVEKIKCLNLNSQKLEDIIHKFFAAVQVPVQVNMNGTPVLATEWYSVPLSVIEKVAKLIVSGDIVHYRYEPAIYDIVRI